MSLWALYAKLAGRWLRMIGRFLPLVALFVLGVGWLLYAAADRFPAATAAVAALLLLNLHRTRRDLHFIRLHLRHPRLRLGAEYFALALLPAALLLLQGAWPWAVGLAAAAPLAALLPETRPGGYRGKRLRIGQLGHSPEWTAGIHRRPVVVLLVVLFVGICCALPYFGFPALYLAACCCAGLYDDNEPLQLLLLPEQGSSRLLRTKIAAAWRNYFLAAAPFALAAGILHPETAWLAALWAPFAALMLVYCVVAKYARYDPAASGSPSVAAQLGLAGFLFLPLLPVSLCLLIRYAVQAENNLDRYLYDYD